MKNSYLSISCALVLAAAAQNAAAQTATSILDEVVVTAQKRSENLQEVPVAVSAFTSETRDLIGISTINDLTNFTPGLSYSTSLDRASLRGIGRQTNNLASDPGLATYTDGFYNVSTRSAARSPLLVDRIEVLRGPQGTLYGRNSIGGTINVISKSPTKDWSGEVRASFDNWQRRVGEATVSGPATDWLRFRVSGNVSRQDKGYYKNVAGGPDEGGVENDHYIEAIVDADLGSKAELWFKASLAGYDNSRRSLGASLVGDYDYGKVPSGYLAPAGAYGLILTGSNFNQLGGNSTTNPTLNDIRSFAADTTTQNKQDDSPTFIAHLTLHAGPMDIKYVGGYTKYKYLLKFDFDGTAVTDYTIPLAPTSTCTPATCTALRYRAASVEYYIEDKRYWSHELNFSSNDDGALQWIGGLYMYDEKYTQPVYFPTENAALTTPAVAVGPGFVQSPTIPNPTGWIYYIDTHLHTTSQAAFGQIDWAITKSWKVTAGLRYTVDKKSGLELTRQLCYGLSSFLGCPDLSLRGTASQSADVTNFLTFHTPAPGTTGLAYLNTNTGNWERGLDSKWSATTGTAGVAWTPSHDTLIFGKYSRGYKAGGFNSGAIVELPRTDAETVDAVEAGWKQQFGGTFQINASAFFYAYKGMQIPLSVIPAAGPTQTQFFNLNVHQHGLEIETLWQPIDRLQVLFNYAYLKATVDDGQCCFVDGVDPSAVQPEAQPFSPTTAASRGQYLDGQTVPQSPEHKLALNVNYTFAFRPGSLTVGASDIWKDATYYSVFNRYYSRAPSYNQIDLRATWKSANDHIALVAFGRNILDDNGYEAVSGVYQTQIPTGGIGVPTIPRSIAENVTLTNPRTYGLEVHYKF